MPQEKIANYYYDRWLIMIVAGLLVLGLLLLTSASMSISWKWYYQPFYFLIRQMIYLGVGLVGAFVITRIPLERWERWDGYLLLGSLLLLVLVLIPGIGHAVNGSVRWIKLGMVSFQVSELAKFAAVVYAAGYLERRQEEVRSSVKGFVKPLVLFGIIASLLILEPDFGAIVVMILTVLGMMYLAGARLWQFVLLLLLVLTALAALMVISPYRVLRLTSFLDPWSRPFDSGYQLVQSLIAFGRGGFWGVGLGNSIQKLFYLPEAHTDFLFAILAEEFGVVGQIVVVGLFGALVARALQIGRMAAQVHYWFASYLAYGIGLIIGLQVIINIGVNIGLLPTKGLTLPFMSYGGSSMLANCAMVGVLLRIYHEVTLQAASGLRHYYRVAKAGQKPRRTSPKSRAVKLGN